MIIGLILLALAIITFVYALGALGPIPLLVNAVLALTLPPGSPGAPSIDSSSDVVKRLKRALGKGGQR
ncbi:MAG: hypothetical protein QXH30_00260, partial [Candidatus Bilamarchaeaceae archaeon]